MHMLQRRFPEPETMSGGNTRVSASSMSPNWYTVERVSWRRRLQRGVKRADRQDMSGGGVGVSFLGAVQRVSSCDKRPQLTPPAHIQTGNIHKYTCCPPLTPSLSQKHTLSEMSDSCEALSSFTQHKKWPRFFRARSVFVLWALFAASSVQPRAVNPIKMNK